MAEALTLSLLVVVVFSVISWALACFLKDASIADLFWPIYHASTAATYLYFALAQKTSSLAVVFTALICIWALRLFMHLFFRRFGQKEDHRYAAIRARNQENFWWQSFFTIFLMQSSLAWLICSPFSYVIMSAQSFSVLHGLGIFVMACGLIYEWIADEQLKKYLRRGSTYDDEKSGVLAKGLWRFCRHPNYFGDWTFWLGATIVTISAGGLWFWLAVFNLLLIYWLLNRFTGVARAEQTLPIRRPTYNNYIESTPAFFPSFIHAPSVARLSRGKTSGFAVTLLTFYSISSSQSSYGDDGFDPEPIEKEIWVFEAFVGKKKIGVHEFEVIKAIDQITAKSSASFEYKVFKIPLLKYEHSVVEIYSADSCLKSISSETTTNSKRTRIIGEKKGDNFFVKGNNKATLKRACLMPFAYWSPKLLDQTALINGQTGKITPIKIQSVDSADNEKNYVLSGKDLNIELTYSSEDQWTGLQSKLPLGRTLKYTLVSYERSAPEMVSLNITSN